MTLYYIATPYSRYNDGTFAAWVRACRIAGGLIKLGHAVYSPIAHAHPIAHYGDIDPLDHKIWLPFDQAMIDRCDALIVAHLDGWDQSVGIAHEIAEFEKAGKPIFDLNTLSMTMAERSCRNTTG